MHFSYLCPIYAISILINVITNTNCVNLHMDEIDVNLVEFEN